jgi:transposase-like protein
MDDTFLGAILDQTMILTNEQMEQLILVIQNSIGSPTSGNERLIKELREKKQSQRYRCKSCHKTLQKSTMFFNTVY